jgi:hypothetical protein
MSCSSVTTRVRVRTTPFTCGSQASVAIRMRIGRRDRAGGDRLAQAAVRRASACGRSGWPNACRLHPGPEGAQQGLLGRVVAVDRALAHPGVAGDLGEVQVLQRAGLKLAATARRICAGSPALAFAQIRQGAFMTVALS